MSTRRTYSMLESLGHAPTAYERVSTHLSWRVTRGCALPLPAEQWHQLHGAEASIGALPWETFSDPAALTYRGWVARAREREAVASAGYAADHNPTRHAASAKVLGPLRFAGHALMMLAGYLGQLAPSGRLTIVLGFQAGDEMRRVHRFAERLFDVGGAAPDLGANARAAWETDAVWRPLRLLFERALVTWDWHESFAATQLAIKPALDGWCAEKLAAHARARGDGALTGALGSLALDHAWHRAWGDALVAFVGAHSTEGAERLASAAVPWRSEARAAVAQLDALLEVP